ncbi:hypothetical protein [Variovorax boronicumulans]|nr:hypothetical protein [Variovorax boronicumulans]
MTRFGGFSFLASLFVAVTRKTKQPRAQPLRPLKAIAMDVA